MAGRSRLDTIEVDALLQRPRRKAGRWSFCSAAIVQSAASTADGGASCSGSCCTIGGALPAVGALQLPQELPTQLPRPSSNALDPRRHDHGDAAAPRRVGLVVRRAHAADAHRRGSHLVGGAAILRLCLPARGGLPGAGAARGLSRQHRGASCAGLAHVAAASVPNHRARKGAAADAPRLPAPAAVRRRRRGGRRLRGGAPNRRGGAGGRARTRGCAASERVQRAGMARLRDLAADGDAAVVGELLAAGAVERLCASLRRWAADAEIAAVRARALSALAGGAGGAHGVARARHAAPLRCARAALRGDGPPRRRRARPRGELRRAHRRARRVGRRAVRHLVALRVLAVRARVPRARGAPGAPRLPAPRLRRAARALAPLAAPSPALWRERAASRSRAARCAPFAPMAPDSSTPPPSRRSPPSPSPRPRATRAAHRARGGARRGNLGQVAERRGRRGGGASLRLARAPGARGAGGAGGGGGGGRAVGYGGGRRRRVPRAGRSLAALALDALRVFGPAGAAACAAACDFLVLLLQEDLRRAVARRADLLVIASSAEAGRALAIVGAALPACAADPALSQPPCLAAELVVAVAAEVGAPPGRPPLLTRRAWERRRVARRRARRPRRARRRRAHALGGALQRLKLLGVG